VRAELEQKTTQSVSIDVEIADRDYREVSKEILKAFCSVPEVSVVVKSSGEKYFTIFAEALSTRYDSALAYRLIIEPGRESDVESLSGKKYFDPERGDLVRARIRGKERLVGGGTHHWIGEDGVVLPFLGDIYLNRAGMMMGPPSPFAAHVFCDHGDMSPYVSAWTHGEYAASISLGLNKELNEDGVMCRLLPGSAIDGDSVLGVVADGLGLYAGGQLAAMLVLEVFGKADYSIDNLQDVAARLPADLKELHDEVMRRQEDGVKSLVGPCMGAPFAAVRIFQGEFEALRAGDCRIAHYKMDGSQYICDWYSMDERMGSTVYHAACLVDGEPQRVHAISRRFSLGDGDYLVVATDGIWDSLKVKHVAQILSTTESVEEAHMGILRATAAKEIQTKYSDNRGLFVYRHQVPKGASS
jgi:serine/threonine protein phosphatase PrpC